jgi:hypothetical protein
VVFPYLARLVRTYCTVCSLINLGPFIHLPPAKPPSPSPSPALDPPFIVVGIPRRTATSLPTVPCPCCGISCNNRSRTRFHRPKTPRSGDDPRLNPVVAYAKGFRWPGTIDPTNNLRDKREGELWWHSSGNLEALERVAGKRWLGLGNVAY